MSPWRRPARMATIADILATAQKRRDPMRHTAAKSEIASAAPLIVEAWRCIGCGRIEAPQPCIGVCDDRKVRFVLAADYEAALALLREAEERAAALEGLVRRLAQTPAARGSLGAELQGPAERGAAGADRDFARPAGLRGRCRP